MALETYREQAERLAAIEDDLDFELQVNREWGNCEGIFRTRWQLGRSQALCLTEFKGYINQRSDGLPFAEELLGDQRIPNHPDDITRESLSAFVEWNERLDAEGVT